MRTVLILAMVGILCMSAVAQEKPIIKKRGTIECDLVEATPLVFNSTLYRFEYVRDKYYKPNTTGDSYFRFVDVETGKYTPGFAKGYHLGAAYVEGDTVYVYGVPLWGKPTIDVFWSKDLKTWKTQRAFTTENWGIYNTSVCKDNDRYVMAIEIGEPPEEVGKRFTIRFAESQNLLDWTRTPADNVYSKEKYTACPSIRYIDDWYYMVYLEDYGGKWNPHIVRSRDLKQWESSPLNPVIEYSDEDKKFANPKFTQEQRDRIANATNINNSDMDFCDYKGRTYIVYSWGNQHGIEHLAEAYYEGTEANLLRGFFPKK